MTPAALRDRLRAARSLSSPDVTEQARRGLLAWLDAATARGDSDGEMLARLADGTVAAGVAGVALSGAARPEGLACAEGCAFCCILSGADGAMMTEAEARGLHAALAPFAGQPDGRAWHPRACAALDPQTRACRAYDARPMICRTYVSPDAEACAQLAEGQAAAGPGTRAAYHIYLAALGLSRAALKGVRRVPSYALSRLSAAAIEGHSPEDALKSARHRPAELDAEQRRSKRDMARAKRPGLS